MPGMTAVTFVPSIGFIAWIIRMPRVCHEIAWLRVGNGRADRGLHSGRVRQLDAEPRVHVLGETTAIPASRRIAPVHVWRALVLERVGDQGGGRI